MMDRDGNHGIRMRRMGNIEHQTVTLQFSFELTHDCFIVPLPNATVKASKGH